MAQILDPIPDGQSNGILCCYVNATNQIQIARITNITNWYFERVVFPGQRLVFETLPGAMLEIHTGMMASAILSDTIPCERLSISDAINDEDDLDGNEVVCSVTSHQDSQTVKREARHYQAQENHSILKPALV